MNLSRVGRVCLAVVALAAVAAGAGGGRAATLALTRAVADTGQSMSDLKPEPRTAVAAIDTPDRRTK